MTLTVPSSAIDLVSQPVVQDPYTTFEELRGLGSFVWLERHRAWLLLENELVRAALNDDALSTDTITPLQRRLSEEQRKRFQPAADLLSDWMIFNDPPIHTALRDPVRTAFTPRSVARLREQIEHETAAIIDRLGGADEFDLVAEVAYPLPATVIAIMLGVPVERHTEFQEWSHQLGALVMGKIERRDAWDRAVMAAQEFQRVFGGLIERYSKNPEDNLITRLVEASASVEKSLTADQLVGACSLLLFGGHETTTSLIANGTLAMLRRPEVRARLVAEPELQKSAVDEFLRFDGPSKIVVRRARNSEPWNGIPVKAGDAIFCCIAAANRDPAVFDRPNDLILDRNPNRHVSFGWGMHHCLGAQLARLEASIVIPQVLRAWPDLKLAVADDQLRYHHTIVGRTLRELPVSIA